MRIIIPNLLQKAIDLSIQQQQTGPFGAIVVDINDQIIGIGQNQVTLTNDPTAHAEIVAIRQACQTIKSFDLSGCVLYASCEPCPMCLSSCYWAHIEKIYYACTSNDASQANFSDTFIYKELALSPLKREINMVHISSFRDKGLEAFDKWLKNPNKINY